MVQWEECLQEGGQAGAVVEEGRVPHTVVDGEASGVREDIPAAGIALLQRL